MYSNQKIAVVIPCFRVRKHILEVLRKLSLLKVDAIYVVDDKCPECTGDYVEKNFNDYRVKVLYHHHNQGVGGAMLTGYAEAVKNGADIIVKIDGDDQMDSGLIPEFIYPILEGSADYTKGNRFFHLEGVAQMPVARVLGNASLSLLTKLSSGYWDIFDPTNGYTAIHASIAQHLPVDKISKNYFFESDMLFRLNLMRAKVLDVPMSSRYGDEISNLKIYKIFSLFLYNNIRNFFKRIFYNYYLRDLSLASLELPLGLMLFCFGTIYGGASWWSAYKHDSSTPVGTVMLSALTILMGFQLILAFLAFDIASVPRHSMHPLLSRWKKNYEPTP